MGSNLLTSVPKYRVIQSGTNFDSLATLMFEAFDWTGRLGRASEAARVPVLYHRGSWLASQGYAPTALDPLPELPFVPGTSPIVRQYGDKSFGRQNFVLRLPTAILYNGKLETNQPVGSGNFAFVDNILQGMTDILAAKNAFCASYYDIGAWCLTSFLPGSTAAPPGPRPVDEKTFKGGTLLVVSGADLTGGFPFDALTVADTALLLSAVGNTVTKPGHSIDTNVAYFTTNLTSATYTSTLSPFTGGDYPGALDGIDVAIGTVVGAPTAGGHTFVPTAFPATHWDAELTDPGPPKRVNFFPISVGTPVLNGRTVSRNEDRIGADLDVLARVVPRFERFKHVIYGRFQDAGTVENAFYTGLMRPLWELLAAQVSQFAHYNTILRGPYNGSEDLTSLIRADIQEFFA